MQYWHFIIFKVNVLCWPRVLSWYNQEKIVSFIKLVSLHTRVNIQVVDQLLVFSEILAISGLWLSACDHLIMICN